MENLKTCSFNKGKNLMPLNMSKVPALCFSKEIEEDNDNRAQSIIAIQKKKTHTTLTAESIQQSYIHANTCP